EARKARATIAPLEALSRSQHAALAQALAFEREARTGSVEKFLKGLAPESPERSRLPAILAASIIAIAVAVGVTYFVLDRLSLRRHSVLVQAGTPEVQRAVPPAPAAVFNPPPHSIAVLPFLNMSGDGTQEYFSDGVSEELINELAHVQMLQVCARTSSFSFKGKNLDVGTIARKLNVGMILEGSIRRSGNTVRITAQMVNAINGFQIWSQSYDRDLRDILTLQTEIAVQVAQEMQAKLLGGETARMEVGGTRNSAAYDEYLRGKQILGTQQDIDGMHRALAAFEQAIALDPNFAAAHAQRAVALRGLAYFSNEPTAVRQFYAEARQAAERAIALARDYADAHIVLGWHILLQGFVDIEGAAREVDRAMALVPGSAAVLDGYAGFQGLLGHDELALDAMRRAIRLDPQNPRYREHLLANLSWARRFEEVLVAAQDVKALRAKDSYADFYSANSHLALGHPEAALRICASPTTPLEQDDRHFCLALAYHALGKIAEARSELNEVEGLRAVLGTANYGAAYAQWGDSAAALRWLATAERVSRPSLLHLKVDWMLDPIRSQPQFQALGKRLKLLP